MAPAWACATCGFRLGEPIASLAASELCFVSDGRFPGRCVLTLREHATELFEASAPARRAFAEDMGRAARAIKLAVDAFKMNYEILGNTDAYLHAHLFPRYDWEPADRVGHPVWLYGTEALADGAVALSARHDGLRARIVAELDRLAPVRPL